MPEPVPALRQLASYSVPRPPQRVDLRLDGNEGLLPPAWLLQGLAGADPELLRRYPDTTRLQALLAARLGVAADRVLVTAGADEALDRVCRAFLDRDRSILLPAPGFEMLEAYARLAGAGVDTYSWTGPFPRAEIAHRWRPHHAVVALVSPNNPTGLAATADDLRAVAAACPGALLLVDLAYEEFAATDLTGVALEHEDAIVVRSLSKGWGIAGLRVGCACGARRWIDVLRAAGSPYSVAGPSLALAEAWVERGEDEVRAYARAVAGRRDRITCVLARGGAAPWPSEANFVLARFADARRVHEELGRRGIAVRAFAGRPGLDDCLRITCPANEEDTARLLGALEEVLA